MQASKTWNCRQKCKTHTKRSLRPLNFIKIKALKTWNCRQKNKTELKTSQVDQDIRSRLPLQSLETVELSSDTPKVAQYLASESRYAVASHLTKP